MAETLRVGIAGGGWPGIAHARAYDAASGFKLAAVADLIPGRRKKLMDNFKIAREYADAMELVRDKDLDVISVCLPNDLHAQVVNAALRAGKHVLCESPPAHLTKDARTMQRTATNAGKVLMYALQRRYGAHELAAKQAIDKGYIGEPYHVRAVWTRTRGIPAGTGWYTEKERSGGGVIMDIGLHMLDLAWSLLGQPKPTTAYAMTQARFGNLAPGTFDVEDAAFALLRFENGSSLELATSWAINQPPHQNGTACRVYGSEGAIEVYTARGPMIYRKFTPKGDSKSQPLKGPKTAGHNALVRAFRNAIQKSAAPTPGPDEGITLMQMTDAIYKSANTGKTAGI